MILDIHTHRIPVHPDTALFSACMKDEPLPGYLPFLSVGIHPWFLTSQNITCQKSWLEQQMQNPCVRAIGEVGLDKCCQTPLSLQWEAFRYACRLAEEHRLPLIIHSVKTSNEIMQLKKELRSSVPWILHGFRGKKELAVSLVRQGFYLSFGMKYQKEALLAVPENRILLETDESEEDILTLYHQVALLRNTSCQALIGNVQETIKFLFFKS